MAWLASYSLATGLAGCGDVAGSAAGPRTGDSLTS